MSSPERKREHKLLWSDRYRIEHDKVMAECDRVRDLGGSFEIKNTYDIKETQWVSLVTIYYPEGK